MSSLPVPAPAALDDDLSFADLRPLLHRTSTCRSLSELLGVLDEELPGLLPARDRVSVVFREPDGEWLRIYRLLPKPDAVEGPLPRVKIEGTPVGEVVRDGVVRVVSDVRADRNITFGHASHDRIRSTVSVPIRVCGDVVGAMNIGSRSPGRCSDEMVPRVHDVAAIVGPALLALERAALPASSSSGDAAELIGESEAFRRLLEPAQRAARSGENVLLTGETGVGKSALAHAIHRWSARCHGPFVTVHLGALSSSLVESELFGHERGAFTGALSQRTGRFERASGGTLFLDEVSDTPLAVQAKLLRVIQEGAFERVGGDVTLHADVRLISASNRDLGEAVARGELRADLLYRLNVVPLRVPPLRERGDDVALLTTALLARLSQERLRAFRLSPAGWRRVRAYPWPGNIRELEGALCRAAALEPSDVLELVGLGETSVARPPSAEAWPSFEEHQRQYIARVLQRTQGVIEGPRGAASLLGMRPSTLRSRMQRLGVDATPSRNRGGGS